MLDEDAARESVARALGHRFQQPELLRDALTHRSFANERPDIAPRDNERLEFLGDAVVDLAASTLLWERFPEAPEGELTRRRADLVCEGGLAAIARTAFIGEALRLGRGEEKSGGRDKPRLLASALEACMGAVLLDSGPEHSLEVGKRLFAARVDAKSPGSEDYKSRVQETVQAHGLETPYYELVASEGPDHDRRFHVVVRVGSQRLGEGDGRSKLEAEQAAAQNALDSLEGEDFSPR
jgi:ribonuclease-3